MMPNNRNDILWSVTVVAIIVLTTFGVLILTTPTNGPNHLRDAAKMVPQAERSSKIRSEGKWGFPSEGGVPRPGFTCKLNARTRQPDWVIWKVDPRGTVDRSGFPFTNDANVPLNQRQHNKDYVGLHWHADGVNHKTDDSRLERGHQKPADNSKGSDELMAACMVLEDNLAPQCSRLNQVVWRGLDLFVTKTAETPGVEVICCTGPLYFAEEGDTYVVQVIADGTTVPTHFFKAVAIEREDGIDLKAWILPNSPTPSADFDEGAVTTDDVEQRAAFDLWPTLPNADELEAKR